MGILDFIGDVVENVVTKLTGSEEAGDLAESVVEAVIGDDEDDD